jgi:hypothetical protein
MFSTELFGPTTRASAITPHDTNLLATACRKFTCTTAGTAAFTTVGGDEIIVSLAVGVVWDACWVKRVKSTGTTAVGIVGYWD